MYLADVRSEDSIEYVLSECSGVTRPQNIFHVSQSERVLRLVLDSRQILFDILLEDSVRMCADGAKICSPRLLSI